MVELPSEFVFSIHGGCADNSCSKAAVDFLQACTDEQLKLLNMLWKELVLSEALRQADPEVVKFALINVVENAEGRL